MSQGPLLAGRNHSLAEEELPNSQEGTGKRAGGNSSRHRMLARESPDQQPGGTEGTPRTKLSKLAPRCPGLDKADEDVWSQGWGHCHCTSLKVFEEKTHQLLLWGPKGRSQIPMGGSYIFSHTRKNVLVKAVTSSVLGFIQRHRGLRHPRMQTALMNPCLCVQPAFSSSDFTTILKVETTIIPLCSWGHSRLRRL